MAQQLTNDLISIAVLDIEGNGSMARAAQFPDIRYTRFVADGWGAPDTTPEKVATLAGQVERIRAYLKSNFGYQL